MLVEITINLIHTLPYMNDVMINISTTDTNSITIPIDLDLFFSVFVPFRVYLIFKFYVIILNGEMTELNVSVKNATQREE